MVVVFRPIILAPSPAIAVFVGVRRSKSPGDANVLIIDRARVRGVIIVIRLFLFSATTTAAVSFFGGRGVRVKDFTDNDDGDRWLDGGVVCCNCCFFPSIISLRGVLLKLRLFLLLVVLLAEDNAALATLCQSSTDDFLLLPGVDIMAAVGVSTGVVLLLLSNSN